MRLLCLLTILVFSSFQAQAMDWIDKGNGGNALYCDFGSPALPWIEVRFFDNYESLARYSLSPAFPLASAAADKDQEALQIVNDVLFRLAVKDPARAQNYMLWSGTFLAEARFVAGSSLLEVPDSGIGMLPTGCSLKQLIVQNPQPLSKYDARYFVASDLWNKMDSQNRAVGILHEVVYRGALTKNPALKSSEKVRLFVALLISNEISNMQDQEYQSTLSSLGL